MHPSEMRPSWLPLSGMRGRVLAVAGSDSGGGAGIQADIKTITALGAYALTAITALTAQDTLRVHAIHAVPPEFLRQQMICAFADPGVDAVKTGMLHSAAAIEMLCVALAQEKARNPGLPVVVDPVILASAGTALLDQAGVAALKRILLPQASLLTPNLPEAALLCGFAVETVADMQRAADVLLTLGVPAVLLKGGHLPGESVTDLLATEQGMQMFHAPRIAGRHNHGTGCTLASGIAAGLAQGMEMTKSVQRAREFVRAALAAAPGFGAGAGPLNHAVWQAAGGAAA